MIIGFSGYKEVGKSSAAEYLSDQYCYLHIKGFKKPLIDLYEIIMSKTYRKNNTTREFLKRAGDFAVGENPNFLVEEMENRIGYDLSYKDITIDDVRADNEAQLIKDKGGCIINIKRPNYGSDGHRTEQGISKHLIDYEIEAENLEELYLKLDNIINRIKGS